MVRLKSSSCLAIIETGCISLMACLRTVCDAIFCTEARPPLSEIEYSNDSMLPLVVERKELVYYSLASAQPELPSTYQQRITEYFWNATGFQLTTPRQSNEWGVISKHPLSTYEIYELREVLMMLLEKFSPAK